MKLKFEDGVCWTSIKDMNKKMYKYNWERKGTYTQLELEKW
jgi:hypothetical protein